MKESWDDLRVVLAMVRHGSLSKAAQMLGVNYTTVARRIAQAEDNLGTRLFDRLRTGYVPTSEALDVARAAEKIEALDSGVRLSLSGQNSILQGPLTITAPPLLIASHLCHVFDVFLDKYPKVGLKVLSSNEQLNLNRREADVAIRISNDPGDTLIGRRLTQQQTASFAAQSIANQIVNDPGHRIDWLGFTFWTGPPKDSLENYPNARIRMVFDDMTAVIGAARAGLGVARMPLFVGRSAGLQQVDVLPPQRYSDIWLVAHSDLWRSAKLQAFRDILLPYFKQNQADFIATP
ncbi:MAG: LysR family transcriptional regulator [Pseudoruegeria sp.]